MKKWVNVLCLTAVLVFLGYHFKPELVLNRNIIAGGDTPSHYGLVHHLAEDFRWTSWMPGNYAGFPSFQLYPPLSFFMILILDKWLPLQVAFKIVMVLGSFLLPLAVFVCLRKLEFAFPAPALGAVFSLVFLFNEGNSMWGANIPSTMAGEFSCSLGFALAIVFVGILFSHVESGKSLKWTGLFLAVIGLTHGYPFVFVVAMSSFFFLSARNLKRISLRFFFLFLLTFLLMGFWLIPALFFLPYTTSFNFIWRFQSVLEIVPPVFMPVLAIAIISHLFLLLKKKMEARIVYLWYGFFISLLGFLFGFQFKLVDIRFLPFAQGMLVLLAAVGIGQILKEFKAIALVPPAALVIIFVGLSFQIKFIDTWIAYNFSGLEEKPLWEEFSALNDYLRGDDSDPRVVYEHSTETEGTGTLRAFENLPLFSGRSTLEGLYMQSSINSPYAYYIQSEVSQMGSHPLMYFNYPRFDLNRAVRHLRLFNVREFVVLHEATEKAASLHPEFIREREFSPFKVFRLESEGYGYVVPLKYKPIFVRTNDWKRLFFHWFRLSPNRVFLVTDRGGILPDGYKSFLAEELNLGLLPAEPFDYRVNLKETVRSQEILIETDRVGHPLLIKVSFHPNWHVEGAQTLHLASPGFMIVFPEQKNIRIHYGPGTANWIGWIGTFLGMILLLIPFRIPREGHSLSFEIKWRWVVLLVLLIPPAVYGWLTHYDAHTLYHKGLGHFHKQDYDRALAYFKKGVEKFPFSPAIDGTYFFYGLCHYKKEDWQQALDIWLRFLEDYPEARTMDEVLYHIGHAYRLLGKEREAEAAFDQLRTKFPESRFAELVR